MELKALDIESQIEEAVKPLLDSLDADVIADQGLVLR